MHNPFEGTWKLIEWVAELPDGNHVFPFGKEAVGRLMYTRQRHMSVQIMKLDRFHFRTDNILQGEAREMQEAYKSFIGYAGTYELSPDEDRITHHILLSSYPNWVGRDQVRDYAFVDGRLHLHAYLQSGKHRLTWEKV